MMFQLVLYLKLLENGAGKTRHFFYPVGLVRSLRCLLCVQARRKQFEIGGGGGGKRSRGLTFQEQWHNEQKCLEAPAGGQGAEPPEAQGF